MEWLLHQLIKTKKKLKELYTKIFYTSVYALVN